MKSPVKNWNKATDILKDHQKKEYHITTSLRADDFLRSAERPEASIASIIDNEAARHYEKQKTAPKHNLMYCILWKTEYRSTRAQ